MGDYGLKVSRPGYDVKNAAPNELVFSSKYSTLKVKQQGSGAIYDSTGRTIIINHGLGYVPYFIVHTTSDPVYGNSGDFRINPTNPVVTGGFGTSGRDVVAYADDTNLYIKVGGTFGSRFVTPQNNDLNYAWQCDIGCGDTSLWIGHTAVDGVNNGAIRFDSIPLGSGEGFHKVGLWIYINNKEGNDIQYELFGIDEDDTNDFSSCPFGRAKTSASHPGPINTSQGDYKHMTCDSALIEIICRAGYSQGNAVGFLLMDDGSGSGDNYISTSNRAEDPVYGPVSHLEILKDNHLLDYKYTIFYNEISL